MALVKINVDEITKSCRPIDCKELMTFLMAHRMKVWSWGINNFVNVYNKALRFTVQGHHHKGHVYIFVNGLDLFDIYLTSSQGNIKDTIESIYLEDLIEILDKRIEYIADYKNN